MRYNLTEQHDFISICKWVAFICGFTLVAPWKPTSGVSHLAFPSLECHSVWHNVK